MTEPTNSGLQALHRANSAHDKIDAHEDLCAERYKTFNEKVDGIGDKLNKLIGTLIMCMIGVSAWSLTDGFKFRDEADARSDREIQELRRDMGRIYPNFPQDSD